MDKTQETYEFIAKYIETNKYPPSIREICSHLSLDSTSSAVYHLKKLEKMGKITRSDNKNRAIELTDMPNYSTVALPVLGTIAAGQPIFAEENLAEHIVVSESFFSGANLFVLKVQGESMINVGIFDGDYVVMQGTILEKTGDETYNFKDNTGTMLIEIDGDAWAGITVTPNDIVIIEGEIDKNTMEPTVIEVEEIRMAK